MKSIIFLLSLSFVFSTALAAQAASSVSEYHCDGEDIEHSFYASVIFESDLRIFKMNFSQATQHDEGPHPLLPLRYQLWGIQGKIHRLHREFEFDPANYQDCSYRWLWPSEWDRTADLVTTLKLDCDGIRSDIELTCVKTEADVHQ